MQPEARYTKSGDVHIAYQMFGEGPLNIAFAPPSFSNVEHWWDEPDVSRWLLRLASYARVVMFDKRGAGSGLRFGYRGSLSLKGIPGEWRMFAIEW